MLTLHRHHACHPCLATMLMVIMKSLDVLGYDKRGKPYMYSDQQCNLIASYRGFLSQWPWDHYATPDLR